VSTLARSLDTADASVSCLAGETLVGGGGVTTTTSSPTNSQLTASWPSASNTWTVSASQSGLKGSNTWTLQAYAICAS
jgi:hypothetical protein